MRIVSYIPSITETLIWAQADVVGRTRFCIYPKRALNLPVVGGTKSLDASKLEELRPDLVIMDREENTLEMSKKCRFPILDIHVTSLESLEKELERLSEFLKNPKLKDLAGLCHQILEARQQSRLIKAWSFLREPIGTPVDPTRAQAFRYVIWKNPWMEVTRETFIGDVLSCYGIELRRHTAKYPTLTQQDLQREDGLNLFSSEPYPFSHEILKLKEEGFSGYLVDGEALSWFGVRALKFLADGYDLSGIDLGSL
jgi:hypothetical protein